MTAREDLTGRHVVFLNWRDLDHPEAGGAEIYCTALAEHLVQLGARVTLVTARAPGRSARESVRGVRLVRRGGRFTVYPAALGWLLLHRRDVDAVVDCQNGIPFFSPLVSGRHLPIIQVIHHVHQKQFPLYFPRPIARIGRFLESSGSRAVYRQRPIAVVSPSTRDEVRAELQLPGPRFLVPNGMLLPPVHSPRPRTATPSIVCVGRLVSHKRYHLLLDALPDVAKQIAGLTVHVVGDGPEFSRLRERSNSFPDGLLRWHGRLPDAERDALLAGAWLSVNPSHGEGWGLSVVEAAAFGVPTLAFRVQGIQDAVLDGRTGWLLEDGQPLAGPLVRALREVSDDVAAQRYAEAARSWAEGFSWVRSGDLLAEIIAAESDRRCQRRNDRRRRDDDLTLVAFPAGSSPALRRTDVCFSKDEREDGAVLYGAAPPDAAAALRRSGVTAHRIQPATDADLLAAVSHARRS